MPKVTLISPATKQEVTKLRVAAYCRVSSNSADQLNSYARQIKVYTDIIKRRLDWEMVEIFADEGISGVEAAKRPEFLRMIKACEHGEINLIITKSVSRFARNVKETLEYVRKLKLLGVGVQFEKEGINTRSLGDEMLINTFAAIAQEESTSISMNMRLANRKRMADGDYFNASEPYGYRYDGEKLVPYEPEAEIVRDIYRYYLEGNSTETIADLLSSRGIPTKSGKDKWRASRVACIISNEKNIGDSLYQKTFTTPLPFKKIKNRGEEDKYYISETHTGIIDRETFERATALLEKRREENARKGEITEYTLSGKIGCAECGSYYRRRVVRGVVRWACANHVKNANSCNSHYIGEDRIYDGFVAVVNKLKYSDTDILAQTERSLESAIQMMKRQNTDAMQISRQISEMNAKLLMLEQLRSKGYLAPEIYQSQTNELTNELNKLKAKRQSAYESKLEDELKKIQTLRKRIDEIGEPLAAFDDMLFHETVESLALNNKDELTVTFIGGISFTEII